MKWTLSRVLIVIFLAILLVVSFVLFIFLNRPAKPLTASEKEKALENILGRKPNFKDAPTGNIAYNGKYVNFLYPVAAKIYVFSDKEVYQKPNLEVFSFDMQNPKIVFNLTVSENGSNIADVSDISGVLFRQQPQQAYTQSELTVSGQKGIVFTKNQDNTAEKTAFFLVNNRIYSIAVTGGSYSDAVNLFDNVIKTLVFK